MAIAPYPPLCSCDDETNVGALRPNTADGKTMTTDSNSKAAPRQGTSAPGGGPASASAGGASAGSKTNTKSVVSPAMSEGYLQAMVFAMPDAVACIDGGNVVTCFNPGAVALFQREEASVVGKPIKDAIGTSAALVDGARLKAKRNDGSAIEVTVSLTPAGASSILVFSVGPSARDPRDDLSPRQLDVLELLMQGHGEKQISAALALSPHTVHDYVKALYKRYGVASRGELLAVVLPKARL